MASIAEELEQDEDREEPVIEGIARLGAPKPKDAYEAYQEISEEALKFGRAYQQRCKELEAIKATRCIKVDGSKTAQLDRDNMSGEDWVELHQSLWNQNIARVARAKQDFLNAVEGSIKRLQEELLRCQ
jgi:glutamyl/glutaminyl-tRNA synthetase